LAANSTAPPKNKKQAAIPPALIVIVLVLVGGLAGFLYLNHLSKQPDQKAPLTQAQKDAAKEYVHNGFLPITDFKMEAHESYLKQQIVEMTGNIGNTGNRVVDLVEIVCIFRDPNMQEVGRRTVAIVKKGSHLSPGEVRQFRLAFDDLPETWNQAMPSLVIERIEFSS